MSDTTITTAGYIVHDSEGVIHGLNSTAQGAWDDMLRTMRDAHILGGAEGMTIMPATAALLACVDDRGGNVAWGKINGIACTTEEEDAP